MKPITSLALGISVSLLLAGASCDDDDSSGSSFRKARLDNPEDAMIVSTAVMEMVGTAATGAGEPTRGPVARLRSLQDSTGGGDRPPAPCRNGGTADEFQEQRDVNSPYAPGTAFTVVGTDYDQCRTDDTVSGAQEVLDGREELGNPASPSNPNQVIEYFGLGTPRELFTERHRFNEDSQAVETLMALGARSDARRSTSTREGEEQLRMVSRFTRSGDRPLTVVMNLGRGTEPFRFDSTPTGAESITGPLQYRAEGVTAEGDPAEECPLGAMRIATEEGFVTLPEGRRGRLLLSTGDQEARVAYHEDGSATVTLPDQEPRRFTRAEINVLPRCAAPVGTPVGGAQS